MNERTEPSTLCEAFQRTATVAPDAVALRTLGGGVEVTWQQYADHVGRIAGGLAALGVRRGDTVAIMLTNRPECHLVDTAAMHLGATAFSVYNSNAPAQIAYVLGDAGARVLVTEAQFLPRIREAGATGVEHVLDVDDGALDRLAPDAAFDFESAWRAVEPDDIVTLIYTSGTTGPPKGVELTHRIVLAQIAAYAEIFDFRPGDRVLSYLPLAHIADRVLSHYPNLVFGTQITSVRDLALVPAALAEVHPTVWGAVPRVWEKLKLAVEMQLHADPAMGDLFAARDAHVLAAIRYKLGLDEVRWSMSGASALASPVHEFFNALGVEINEIWGMSECAMGTASPRGQVRIGTIGKAIAAVETKLAGDGELLLRGPTVMKGYRDNPEATAEAVDADGWLHTGDVVTVDADGYYKIVDRKKELIINASGKNMSPANIQNAIVSGSPLIGAAMVAGDNRPYNVALIVLEPEAAGKFAADHGIDPDPAALAADDRVLAAVTAGVEAGNVTLSRVEQVKRFKIMPEYWLPGGDEITPTMKMRRRNVATKYAADLDDLYDAPAG